MLQAAAKKSPGLVLSAPLAFTPHAIKQPAAGTKSTKGRARAKQTGSGGAAVASNPVLTPVLNSNPWSGNPWVNPFNAAELQFYASLVNNVNLPPKYLVPIYKAAASRYNLPWQLLAAINREETDYGADLSVSSAGAVGWMQFMPGTWKEYGMAIDSKRARVRVSVRVPMKAQVRHGHFVRRYKVVRSYKLVRRYYQVPGNGNPYKPQDAIFSAARLLHLSGASRSVPRAVFAYNHADWYVLQVLSIAQQINVHGLKRRSKPDHKIGVMVTTARLLNGMPYVWGGGHQNWTISLGYDCSGFVSMVLHSAGFLKSPQTTQTLPFTKWMRPGKGRWVTIYDRTNGGALTGDHVIIDLKGQWWESGGGSTDGGHPRVHRIKMTKAIARGYLPTFNVVMHPYGL